ncbi:MAG: hypothetical protein IKG15_09475 [Solobacterium sp.]|nr:hypothetical protein [Solobacterium sp.]
MKKVISLICLCLIFLCGCDSSEQKFEEEIVQEKRNMSVSLESAIKNSSKVLQSLSWINTGLSAANLVTTVVGFAIMNTKLNRIADSISELKEELNKIVHKHDIDIVKNFKEVKQDYSDMLNAIKIHEEFDEQQYYNLTTKMYIVLDYLYDCYMGNVSGNNDALLEAIFTMLPMFANTLCKYDTVYYYKHREVSADDPWHNSHNDWNSLFGKFMGKEFLDKLQDYCFIDKELSAKDSMDTVATTFLLALNGKTTVEDHQDLLICFDEYKNYAQFENDITEEVVQTIQDNYEELDEETLELINPALAGAAKQFALAI